MNKTDPRIPRVEANGSGEFTLSFTKADADALASCLDVTLKSAGLPAAQAVNLWMAKVQQAMQPKSE